MTAAAGQTSGLAPFPDTPSQPLTGHLPLPTAPFFGRAWELAEITRLLSQPDCRLVTILAPGGMGKTRLGLQSAAALQTTGVFPDGVHFVSLAPVRSVEFLPSAILEVFACYLDGAGNSWSTLLAFLKDRQLLLLLDNFEHLLASADLLPELLAAAPGVKLLVTSRERLNLREEWLLELRGLDYPVNSEISSTASEMLETSSAVQLFLRGARQVRPGFSLRPEDLPAVLEICRLVDGMPLGLELAAAWVQLLSVEEIAREIQHSLDFLSTTLRNVPERHRSLRAVFEHSWSTLTSEEQACLRRLSVFHNPFDLPAAQQVSWATLRLLLALTDKSLIRRRLDGRYEIHELLRQFAESRLSSDEYTEVRDEHARYCAAFLSRLLPDLKSARQGQALDAMLAVLDDVRGAWQHAVHRRLWQIIAEMIEPLSHYAMARYRFSDVRDLAEIAVAALPEHPSDPAERLLLGCLLSIVANTGSSMVPFNVVEQTTQRSLSLLEEFAGQPATALPLLALGAIRLPPGRKYDHREEMLHAGMKVAAASGDRWATAYGHLMLGWQMQNRIRYPDARQHFAKALDYFREIGQPLGQAMALDGLDSNYRTLGEHERANECLHAMIPLIRQYDPGSTWIPNLSARIRHYETEESFASVSEITLREARAIGDKAGIAWSQYHVAWSEIVNDQYEGMAERLEEALTLFRELEDLEGEVWALIYLGVVALANHEPDAARRRALDVFERLEGIDFPWAVAGAHYLLGDIALAVHDLPAARQAYVQSIQIAHQVQSVLQVLRHLTGLMEWLVLDEDYETALLLGFYIYQHSTTSPDSRRRSDRLNRHLQSYLTAEEVALLEQRSKSLSLDDAVTLALASVGAVRAVESSAGVEQSAGRAES